MPKPRFNDEFSQVERDLIHRLAEIEASDRNMCAGCGGEDCVCCEIYLDRQKWVPMDKMFDEMRDNQDRQHYEREDDEDYEGGEDDEDKKTYPCDTGECPYGGESNRSYFCRDNCGLGVDENSDLEEPHPCDAGGHEWESIDSSGEDGTETLQCIVCGQIEHIKMT